IIIRKILRAFELILNIRYYSKCKSRRYLKISPVI
ncbi:hypothetical protein FWK35_00012145, partial [Aphis craccivora]